MKKNKVLSGCIVTLGSHNGQAFYYGLVLGKHGSTLTELVGTKHIEKRDEDERG